MIRPLVVVLVLLSQTAVAQPILPGVRVSGGALVGYQRIPSGSGVTAGLNAGFEWRSFLAQVHMADMALSTYRQHVSLPDGTVLDQSYNYTTLGFGLDVHYVHPVAGPVAATVGTGLIVSRLSAKRITTVDGVPSPQWQSGYRLYTGVLVGAPGRVRGQARIALALPHDAIEVGRIQVGLLVPIR